MFMCVLVYVYRYVCGCVLVYEWEYLCLQVCVFGYVILGGYVHVRLCECVDIYV